MLCQKPRNNGDKSPKSQRTYKKGMAYQFKEVASLHLDKLPRPSWEADIPPKCARIPGGIKKFAVNQNTHDKRVLNRPQQAQYREGLLDMTGLQSSAKICRNIKTI